ncbi:hypothetical protein [Qipengyuania sp. ASV99]|uniref:hypothetical protein n=1 Tax=Qipengyuania sp. ASV99 TaxID=3399681 RepID=UPI003A4C82F6
MTNAVQTIPADSGAPGNVLPADGSAVAGVPESWRELRENSDIQFDEIQINPPDPPEPGWFDQVLIAFFQFLADLFAPVGQFIGSSWPVLQWVVLGLLAVFVLYLLLRTFGPLAGKLGRRENAEAEPEWQPDRQESIALLEDADRLAAEGRFDEATHLLLQRSVTQIAAARPDWVEPSSTARELAALPALSEAARAAFTAISQRVERSLFALRTLDRSDWDAARSAYASFALARIDGRGKAA